MHKAQEIEGAGFFPCFLAFLAAYRPNYCFLGQEGLVLSGFMADCLADTLHSYLTTITDANTGSFASRSVITLHTDHTLTVIDSNQGSVFPPFSSQQGTWATSPSGHVVARTINWRFPFATEGTARQDYNFATVHTNQLSGSITLAFFPPNGNPLDGGGTEAGTFNFTGIRMTVP